MKKSILLGLLAGFVAASGVIASEVEENQWSSTQLVLRGDRLEELTEVRIGVPLLVSGRMTMEEFGKRFTESGDKTLLQFLNALKSGEGDFQPLINQGSDFKITDEAAFRKSAAAKFFPPGGELFITGIIPVNYGRAYIVETWVGDDWKQTTILPVVFREETPGDLIHLVHDIPLLELLQNSLRNPSAAHEVSRNNTGESSLNDDPWVHLRPRALKPGEDAELTTGINALVANLEAGNFEKAIVSSSRAYLTSSLNGASKAERSKKIAEWVKPIKDAKSILSFAPIYVLLGEDKEAAPVILLQDEEGGVQLARAGSKDAFADLIFQLRIFPVREPIAVEEEEETAPH